MHILQRSAGNTRRASRSGSDAPAFLARGLFVLAVVAATSSASSAAGAKAGTLLPISQPLYLQPNWTPPTVVDTYASPAALERMQPDRLTPAATVVISDRDDDGVADRPASDAVYPTTSAPALSNLSSRSPAVPDELRVAGQQLTAGATDGARELWRQIARAKKANDDSATTTGRAASNSAQAGGGWNVSGWPALWRPMTVTNESSRTSGASSPVVAAAKSAAELPEAERVPRLMQSMFYTTNESANRFPPEELTARDSGRSFEDRIGDTSLVRQFALSENEELQSLPLSSGGMVLQSESEAWYQNWFAPWSSMADQLTMTNEPVRAVERTGDVIQVAFLQETLPAPDLIDLPAPDEDQSKDDPSDDGSVEKKEDSLAEAEKLGSEPEDNSLQFLRTQTVLLEPGKMRFDIGLEYTLSEFDFPIFLTNGMLIVGVDDVHIRNRELAVPMELRYGLLKRVQLFLQVPVGWSNLQAEVNNVDFYLNDGGLGDVSWGATIQLQDATKDRPYIIGTISATAPTGGSPFTGAVSPSPSGPSLGNGFFSVAANVTVIRIYDPVVVFYGVGARRHFDHRYVGLKIQPGPEYNYTLGVGFSVNEKVTFSTQFFGSYVEDLKVDGERVEGSNQEPMSLRFAATFAKPSNRLVEPFVTFGITDDAVSTNFGITWTY